MLDGEIERLAMLVDEFRFLAHRHALGGAAVPCQHGPQRGEVDWGDLACLPGEVDDVQIRADSAVSTAAMLAADSL